MHRFIFGCGYLGLRIARLWDDAGDIVSVLTRSDKRALELGAEHLFTCGGDVTEPQSLNFFGQLPTKHLDTVLFAVGYDRDSKHSIEEVYAGGVQNVLAALPDSTRRFIYISTTGVYGDANGGWVDEDTTPAPTRAGGLASLAAEEIIFNSRFAERSIILRLAGIYGPDRLPYLKQLTAGEPIEAPAEGHLNLIHVDDAARIIERVASPDFTVEGPATYCVSDGHPVVREEYYREVARQLRAPAPRFATPPADSPRAARAAADKRINNARLLDDLEIKLQFPTYREGLAAIVGY